MSDVSRSTALEMRNITKRFPGVVANDSINLKVESGEIHALLGENGAGKSTLMKILSGIHSQDEGDILVNGEETVIESPNDAERNGIEMVYQHFMLINKLTILENIALGQNDVVSSKNNKINQLMSKFGLDRLLSDLNPEYDELRTELTELADQYGIDINLDDHIWELDVGGRQKVEILKSLHKDSQILVLDEPTAVLTPQESQNLFRVLKEIADDGVAIIFITHRLDEVIQHADKTTVIRDGIVVDTVDPGTATESELAEMMVGDEVLLDIKREELVGDTDERVLMTVDLSAKDERGQTALNNVNIEVKKGEIVGIAGVSGNGQSELAQCLAGVKKPTSGKIYFESEPIEHEPISEYINRGISIIPEDRHKFGSVPSARIIDNVLLGKQSKFTNKSFIDWGMVEEYSNEIVDKFDVKTPNINTKAASLSGGNLQKLICGREIDDDPKFLIANQPTRGVDVGAIEHIRQLILDKRKEGTGILLISEDLNELFQMSDKILVLHDGEIVYRTNADESDRKTVGRFMSEGNKAETNIENTKLEA